MARTKDGIEIGTPEEHAAWAHQNSFRALREIRALRAEVTQLRNIVGDGSGFNRTIVNMILRIAHKIGA